MGAPKPPTPIAPPPPPDKVKAKLDALAYSETERKLREGRGRKGSFLTTGLSTGTRPGGGTSLLGS